MAAKTISNLKTLAAQIRDLEEKIGKCNDERDRLISLQAAKLAAGHKQCGNQKEFLKFAKDCGFSKSRAYELLSYHEGKSDPKEAREKRNERDRNSGTNKRKSDGRRTKSNTKDAEREDTTDDYEEDSDEPRKPEDIVFAVMHRISTTQGLAADVVALVKEFETNHFVTVKKTKETLQEFSGCISEAIHRWTKIKETIDRAIENSNAESHDGKPKLRVVA